MKKHIFLLGSFLLCNTLLLSLPGDFNTTWNQRFGKRTKEDIIFDLQHEVSRLKSDNYSLIKENQELKSALGKTHQILSIFLNGHKCVSQYMPLVWGVLYRDARLKMEEVLEAIKHFDRS